MKQVTDLNKKKKIISIILNELEKNSNVQIYFKGRKIPLHRVRKNSKIEVYLHQKSNYISVLLTIGSNILHFEDDKGQIYCPVFRIQPNNSREPEIDPPIFSHHNKNIKLRFVRKCTPNYYKQIQYKVKTFSINKYHSKRHDNNIIYTFTKKF